ncbi:MAG TPA: PEP-CTERM sorting domain-containing protein [Candidatus Paceibacterota bacterium]|nr:PEP-CTERM sorting domain-containing protein [Verrucomicrobiota bacterium]HRY49204.1 PEP-CTERM sorting domain-containing protein [Candidatus Paceibacterota bacterium]HSA03098.1 PEP-CTERM sorting domain-containing protein [Candidatus Paceibacterota bacterium]
MNTERRRHLFVVSVGIRILGVFFLITGLARAAVVESFSFDTFGGSGSLVIPDGNPVGVSDTRTVSTSLGPIISLTVSLEISAQYNGDLYVYLQHEDTWAVLLNRPGRTGANPFGYADSGFSVTLTDDSLRQDIHLYRDSVSPAPGAPLTGAWQPDGRALDPDSVTDAGARTSTLSGFTGLDPNGAWTLFVADMSSGGASAINGWNMEITAVPEPAAATVVCGVALSGFGLWRFWRGRRRSRPDNGMPGVAADRRQSHGGGPS